MGERLVATTSCMKTLSTTLISSPRWELTTRKKRDRCVASPSKNQLLDRLGLVPDLKGLLKTHLLHRPGVVKSICTVTPLRKMPSLQQSQSSSIAFSTNSHLFALLLPLIGLLCSSYCSWMEFRSPSPWEYSLYSGLLQSARVSGFCSKLLRHSRAALLSR